MKRIVLNILILFSLFFPLIIPDRALAQGPTTCKQLHVLLLVDNSGSMSGNVTGVPTDPLGIRFDGPKTIIDLLLEQQLFRYPEVDVQFAVVYWGSRPEVAIPWTEIKPKTKEELESPETIEQVESLRTTLYKQIDEFRRQFESLGETNVLRAFQAASSLFRQLPAPQNECPVRVIVLLTDGQPYLSEEANEGRPFNVAEHMAAVKELLQSEFPIANPANRLYIVGINNPSDTTYWERMESYWLDLAGDPDRIGLVTEKSDVARRLHTIVQDVLESFPAIAAQTVKSICPGEVIVPPYLQTLSFTLFKEELQNHLEIEDEKGPVTPGRQDMTVQVIGRDAAVETITIRNPLPGRWQVNTTLGQARCDLEMRSIKAQGILLKPKSEDQPFTMFMPVEMFIRIVDTTNKPLPDYGKDIYRLNVELQLRTPDGSKTSLQLTPRPNSEYAGSFVPEKATKYTIVATARSKDAKGKPVIVFSDRYMGEFNVESPQMRFRENFSGQTLRQYQSRIDFDVSVLDAKGNVVELAYPTTFHAVLEPPDGKSTELQLRETEPGVYKAEVPLDQAGLHTLLVSAKVQLPNGDKYSLGEEKRSFEVLPSWYVAVSFIPPEDNKFIATDVQGHPTDYRLRFRVTKVGEGGIDPSALFASTQGPFFTVKVVDEDGNELPAQILPTGEVGEFEIAVEGLGVGRYTYILQPAGELREDFLWQNPGPWQTELRGVLHPRYILVRVLIAAAIASVLLFAGLFWWGEKRARKNPLSGIIEIYAVDSEGNREFKSSLGLSRYNRIVFNGLYMRWPRLWPVWNRRPLPRNIRKVEVRSRDAHAGQGGAIEVRVWVRGRRAPYRFTLAPGTEHMVATPGTTYVFLRPPTY